MRESQIEKAVCEYAKQRGWYNMKLNGPGSRGKPDRMFYKPGGYVRFVEFKATGKQLRPLQAMMVKKLRACNLECYVIDSIAQGRLLFDG